MCTYIPFCIKISKGYKLPFWSIKLTTNCIPLVKVILKEKTIAAYLKRLIIP